MQRFIYFFLIFALSLATNVSVYDLDSSCGEPVFKSVLPWKFGFTSSDELHMAVRYFKKSPTITKVVATFESDHKAVQVMRVTLLSGMKAFVYQLSGSEVTIYLNLFTSNGLCTSMRIAEGRVVSKICPEQSEKEYKYTDICFKKITRPCVLHVNLEDLTCNGSLVTETKMDTTTARPVTDLKNLSYSTFISNVPTSSHNNQDTTTNTTLGNVTNVNTTHNTVIVIGSLSGIALTLLAIIAIWKRCWTKHSPQGTLNLRTNHHLESFYLNMLFRRECDQEIAEIDQHYYEEITPQVTKGD